MSGRLVISRHKSYHVWNQDNVEKVMRDERLHREQQEAQAQRERDGLQEKSRELLLASAPSAGELDGQVSDSRSEKELFSLFGDIEAAAADEMARKVKRAEQQAKDQLLLRQNGAAPWALGEGSREQTKRRAWYEDVSADGAARSSAAISVMGRVVTGPEAVSARSRDSSRKRQHDPMAPYMPYLGSGAVVCAESKTAEGDTLDGDIDSSEMKHEHKNHKRHKEEKQHSSRKKDKKEKKRRSRSASPGEAQASEVRLMQDLRRRRLERERMERKKAAVLLTSYDIYGGDVGKKNNIRPR